MDRITLERYRWPFVAARASMLLLILTAFAITDPAGSVDSPAAASARPFELFGRDIVITASNDSLFVAGQWWPPEKLGEKLAWMRAHNPDSRLVLRAHRDVTTATVRKAFVVARAAGYTRITIETGTLRPLLMRRTDDLFRLSFDNSVVKTPPDEGMGFEIRGVWY